MMLPRRKNRIDKCNFSIVEIIKTIIASRKEYTVDEFSLSYGINSIVEIAMAYGLDMDTSPQFITWPTFLGANIDDIHIASVCFGALSLFERTEEYVNPYMINDSLTKSYINAAINTLIVTNIRQNNSDKRCWPTNYIHKNHDVEFGTINQTTVALSTLLTLGFLSPENSVVPNNLSTEQLSNRYRFIVDNINWLLDMQSNCIWPGVWSYAEQAIEASSDKKIEYAILPSHFCYETILKYYDMFTSSDGITSIISQYDSTVLLRMEKACSSFERWLKSNQNDDGGYSQNSNNMESSYIHSCLAEIPMFYAVYSKNEALYRYSKERISQSSFRKLLKYLSTTFHKINPLKNGAFDQYRYYYSINGSSEENSIRLKDDIYELVAESIIFYYNTRLIASVPKSFFNKMYLNRIQEINYKAFECTFSRMCRTTINNQSCLVIKGRQELSRIYPIYAMYYAKRSMERVRNNDVKKARNRLTYFRAPFFMPVFYILLTMLLLSIVFLSYYISSTDTITTILMGIAALVLPYILNYFFQKK